MRNLILTLLLAMTSASAESQSLTFSQILTRPELKTTQPDRKIAYGKDATTDVLTRIATASGGKAFSGDPDDIGAVYLQISSYF